MPAEARRVYAERARRCAAAGDLQGEAHAIRHLADIARRAGERNRAERHYRRALSIYRDDPETAPMNLANALRGFALLQSRSGGPTPEALAAWREARRIYHQHNVASGVSECDEWLQRSGNEAE